MRQLDNWQTYLNWNGKPLRGRLTFYKLHTTEKANIYNEKFEVLASNPIDTNILGQTERQVFLDDIDYTIKLEQYNGGDPSEESSWTELRTFDNLYPVTKKTTVISDAVKSFASIEDLREADPEDIPIIKEGEPPIIQVTGYYEEGDMPPVWYILTNDNSSVDDGGSILRVDSQRVWKLIAPQILDVRVFGVFPSPTYTDVEAYESQLYLAFRYANALGIAVYMPAVYPDGGYYIFEGGNHELNQTLYLDTGTHISGKTGTTSTLKVDKIEGAAKGFLFMNYTYNTGNLTLTVKSARISWMSSWANDFLEIEASEEFIIDMNVGRSKTFKDLARVVVTANNLTAGGTLTFDNIQEFVSPSNLSVNLNCRFRNMNKISDTWWRLVEGNHKIDLTKADIDPSNNINIEDFLYTENYCRIMNKNNLKEFDLNGRTLPMDIGEIYENCIFKNGTVENLHVKGNITFRNMTVSLYTTSNTVDNVVIEDTIFTGSFPFSTHGDIYVRGSSFKSNSTLGSSLPFRSGSSCILKDSIFSGYILQVPYNAIITGCTFDSNDYNVNSSISCYVDNSTDQISITFTNNILTGGKLRLEGFRAASMKVVNSVFVGNNITASTDGNNFITWDKSLIATSGHQYTYANNSGPGVLQASGSTTILKNVPLWYISGANEPTGVHFIYGDAEVFSESGSYRPLIGWTVSAGVPIPTYGEKTTVGGTSGRRWWLKGLSAADFNLFCFADSDYDSKYITYSLKSKFRNETETEADKLAPSISSGSGQGLPKYLFNLSGEYRTVIGGDDTSLVPVPYAYQDLVIEIEISNLRIVN